MQEIRLTTLNKSRLGRLVANTAYHTRLLTIVVLMLIGCASERKETPTKGNATILVSESVAPIIKEEQMKFEELYPQAKVNLQVTTTREAIVQFFNVDSIKTVVASRPLNAEERAAAQRFHLTFTEYKIAIDGIAMIVHRDNPITQLRTTQLDSIFRGISVKWSMFGWKNTTASVSVCLPDQNAGEFEIVATKILQGEKFTSPAKIASSSTDMLQYVAAHSNALGFVSLSWLSDYKDKVKVLELSDPSVPDSLDIKEQYFSPHQAHVYRGFYPLTTDVYIYTRTDMYSVGAGFITFVTSAPGQKIILNNGLVPATMPVRLVEITNKSLQQ